MSEISAYLMSIVGVVLLTVVVDLILPEGKVSKYIKSFFAIFVVAVILSPVSKLFGTKIDFGDWFNDNKYDIDQDFVDNTKTKQIRIMEENMQAYLKKSGFENVEITVSADITNNDIKINFIYADLANLVIKNNDAHINYYTKIKELICEQMRVEEEMVLIYGAE